MRRYTLVVPFILGLGLSGCAIPPALSIASYFIDIVTYVATGKGPSENIASALIGQDCGLWHLIQGKDICIDYPEQDVSAGTSPYGGSRSAAVDQTHRFVVIGTFEDPATAQDLAARLDGVNLTILEVEMSGGPVHQVIAGPLNEEGLMALRQRLAEPNKLPARELGELARAY